MTQEDKELLLNDLCARLPYGVKCCDFRYNDDGNIVNTINTLECIYSSIMKYKYKNIDAKHDIERIKPYLRPMSSMTKEEEKEYHKTFRAEAYGNGYVYVESVHSFDWLDAHHFDYRGLIEKDLALEAPEGMYNLKEK